MRSFSFVLAFLFTFIAISYAWPSAEFPTLEARKHGDGNSTKTNSPQRALQKSCKKLRKLNALSQIAANQTKLDAWVAEGKLNTDEVDAIKAKAANATAELQTMESNTTLVSECAVVDAERKSVNQCKQMKGLAKLAALAGNETAMTAFEQKKGLNQTGVEKLKAKIAEAQTKLTTLQSNTTLTDFCTQRAQQKQEKGDDSSSASASEGTTASQVTGGAAGLTAQTMPYILVPALAAVFALFL